MLLIDHRAGVSACQRDKDPTFPNFRPTLEATNQSIGSFWICGIKRMRIADAEPKIVSSRYKLTFPSIFSFSFQVFFWSRSPLEQGAGDKSLEVNSPRFLFGSRPNGNVSIFRPRCATTIRLIEMYLSSKWNSMQRYSKKKRNLINKKDQRI